MGDLLFFGDSITAGAWDSRGGWANRLIGQVMTKTMQAQFKPNSFYCMAYNLGVSGDTVPDVLDRLNHDVRARAGEIAEPLQLVHALGVNDSQFLIDENRLKFSEREFEHNVTRLIDLSLELTSSVSFIGLLPVNDDLVNPMPWSPGEAYANRHVRRFETIIGSVCDQRSVPFLSLFDRWSAMPDYKAHLIDGVHPNEAGHALLADEVGEFLFTDDFRRFHSVG